MDDTSPVARLSIEIQEERIEQGAIEVLSQIRPIWTASDIQFKVFFSTYFDTHNIVYDKVTVTCLEMSM